MHKLLARQIARATAAGGELDLARLLSLVDAAYEEADRDRDRTDRAALLMSEEMEQLTDELRRLLDAEALRNQRFDAALEHMSQGLCLFDADCRLLIWNRRLIEILGLPPLTPATGMLHFDVLKLAGHDHGEATRIAQEHRAVAERGERWSIDRRLRNGRTITMKHEPLPDGGYLVTLEDTTERFRAQQAERAARERAERADRAKSSFMAGMSHELRTPLNAVIGFSEMIEQEVCGTVSPRYREYAGLIRSSGQHLLAIINDLLDIAKLQSGKIELRREPTAVAEMVDASLRLLAGQAQAAGVALAAAVEPALPLLEADPTRLRQIILNLVGNSIKFSHPGSTVTVAGRRTPAGIEISVADEGVGMSEEEIPKALEPFGQVDNALTREHQGTGLGLPLSKDLVELHGATFAIASARGCGTTVTIVFPAANLDHRPAAA